MVVSATAALAATAKLLSPLINDLYATAKGGAAKAMRRWKESSFPRRLAKRIHAIEYVKTLWSPENEVSLLKFYYPPKIWGLDRRSLKGLSTLSELGEGNIVIQGIVGQGKSILLRYLALQEAIKTTNNRLPIFVELRTLTSAFNLTAAIHQQLTILDIEIPAEAFDHLASSGRTALLLDGFDELDDELVKFTLNEITFLSQKYPELQIVVTSRPSNKIQKIAGFKVARIMGLTRTDYAPFLVKLGLDQKKIFDIREAIKNSPSKIADLISTPLMLTLVVIVYESEKEIPATLPEFFEKLFQIVFSRHDRLKAGFDRKRYSGLSERRLQSLFEAFCFMTLQNGFGRSFLELKASINSF